MRNIIKVLAACGAGVFAAHADDVVTPRPAYIATSVYQAAGINLSGEGFPGEGVEAWLSKPADQVTFLKNDWETLLTSIKRLDDVSVLTGNETVMHLSTGRYDDFKGREGSGLVVSKGVDLRLFMSKWRYGAAILPASGSAPGFVFFDSAGKPVHRILLTESSNAAEFDALVAEFKGETPAFSASPEAPDAVETPTEDTKAAFLAGWRALKDTHEFSGLLRDHKLSRIDAVRLAEGEFSAQLDPAAYSALFGQLVEQEVSILLFALNDGCVQISTGAITEMNQTKGTLQLVEEDSRTLIALPRIEQVWRVSKPTEDGLVHSLELYDADGEPVVYLFGSEKGDSTSIVKWKDLLFALPLAGEGAVKVAGETAEAPVAL